MWSVVARRHGHDQLTPAHARLVDEAVRGNVVHLAISSQTGEAVCQIYPWTDQDGSCGQWYALVAHCHEHAEYHAATCRVASEYDGRRIVLLFEEVEVGGQTWRC